MINPGDVVVFTDCNYNRNNPGGFGPVVGKTGIIDHITQGGEFFVLVKWPDAPGRENWIALPEEIEKVDFE